MILMSLNRRNNIFMSLNMGYLFKGSSMKKNDLAKKSWPDRDRDWNSIITVALFVAVVLSVLSYTMFLRISREYISSSENPASEEVISFDQDALRQTVDFYENKAINLENLKGYRQIPSDPSI